MDADRDEPGSVRLINSSATDVVRSIANLDPLEQHMRRKGKERTHPEANHDTESNSQLLHSNQRTTDLRRCQFCIVKRHDHGQTTNTETGDEPTREDIVLVLRASLHNDTHAEHHHGNQDSQATTESIGKISVNKGSNPGAELENGCQQSLLDTRVRGITVCLNSY